MNSEPARFSLHQFKYPQDRAISKSARIIFQHLCRGNLILPKTALIIES